MRHRLIRAILILCISPCTLGLHALDCPPGTVQVGSQQEQQGNVIIIHPLCQQISTLTQPADTPASLANDPEIAGMNQAQLELIDRRIAGIQRALPLLSGSNPEWGRERTRLQEAMREEKKGIAIESINVISLGLASWLKFAAEANVSAAETEAVSKALQEPMASLPMEQEQLQKILSTTSDPKLTQAILQYQDALQHLHQAEDAKQVVDAAARTRDAAEILHNTYELIEEKPPAASTANVIYGASAFIGGVAIVFATAGAEAAATAASATASLAVGGREALNYWQELQQAQALNQQASSRNRMRTELNQRLADLEQERTRVTWALQHAGGTAQ